MMRAIVRTMIVTLAMLLCLSGQVLAARLVPQDLLEAQALLESYGVPSATVNRLGPEALSVADLIRQGHLKRDVVVRFCQSVVDPVNPTALEPIVRGQVDRDARLVYTDLGAYPLPPDSLASPAQRPPVRNVVKPLVVDLPDHPGTGAYWKALSNTGYYKMTAYVDTPPTQYLASSNDVPYLYLGLQTSSGMVDAGLGWNWNTGKWMAFTNGYTWQQQNLSITAGPGVKLYLSVAVTSTDVYQLRVIDPSTGATVGQLSEALPSSYQFSQTNPSIQARYVSAIAQHTESFSTGSYFTNAHWRTVYVYNSSGYYLTSARTYGTGMYPDAGVVTVTVNQSYYDVTVSVHY